MILDIGTLGIFKARVIPMRVDESVERGRSPPVQITLTLNEEKSREITRMLDLQLISHFDGKEERP